MTIKEALDDPLVWHMATFMHCQNLTDNEIEDVFAEVFHYISMLTGTFLVRKHGVTIEFVDFPESEEGYNNFAFRATEKDETLILSKA